MSTQTDILTRNGIPELFGFVVDLWRNLCFVLLFEGECRWIIAAVAAIKQYLEKDMCA
jgi:hypothetical protein